MLDESVLWARKCTKRECCVCMAGLAAGFGEGDLSALRHEVFTSGF